MRGEHRVGGACGDGQGARVRGIPSRSCGRGGKLWLSNRRWAAASRLSSMWWRARAIGGAAAAAPRASRSATIDINAGSRREDTMLAGVRQIAYGLATVMAGFLV